MQNDSTQKQQRGMQVNIVAGHASPVFPTNETVLCSALQKKGVDVALHAADVKPYRYRGVRERTKKGEDTWTFPVQRYYAFTGWKGHSLVRGVRKGVRESDIIHIQDVQKHICIQALREAESKKLPIALTVHLNQFRSAQQEQAVQLLYKVLRSTLENTVKHIFAATQQGKEVIQTVFPTYKGDIEVLPFPVDDEVYTPRAVPWLRSQLQISEERQIVLFVGKIGKAKGVDILIKALEEIQNVHLVCIGFPSEKKEQRELSQLAEKCLQGRYSFLSAIQDQRRIAGAMREAEIFVMPSQREVLSMAIQQAMLVGTPVIASRVGGIPTAVQDGNTGMLFSPGNVYELRKQIELLMGNKGLQKKFGEASMAFAKNTWSSSGVAHVHVERYAEMLQTVRRTA